MIFLYEIISTLVLKQDDSFFKNSYDSFEASQDDNNVMLTKEEEDIVGLERKKSENNIKTSEYYYHTTSYDDLFLRISAETNENKIE